MRKRDRTRPAETHLVFYAKLHERPWVTSRGAMLQSKAFDPGLVLVVCDDCHAVAFRLEAKSEGDVRLHIAPRANGQANEMFRRHAHELTRRRVDRLRKLEHLAWVDALARLAERARQRGEN